MPCQNHAEVDQTTPCHRCAKDFCDSCLVEIKGAMYCAACKETVVDRLKAGEGLEGGVRKATMLKRFVASILDHLIMMVPQIVISIIVLGSAFATLTGPPESLFTVTKNIFVLIGVAMLLNATVQMIYFGVMEGKLGQTVGKMALRIEVISLDGQRCGVVKGCLRNFFYQLFQYITPFVYFFFFEDLSPAGVKTGNIVLGVLGVGNLVYLLVSLFLAVSDKSANRFIHDRVTKTRVVMK